MRVNNFQMSVHEAVSNIYNGLKVELKMSAFNVFVSLVDFGIIMSLKCLNIYVLCIFRYKITIFLKNLFCKNDKFFQNMKN